MSKEQTISLAKRNQYLMHINFMCTAYLVIWSVSPPLAWDMIFRILAFGATASWFLTAYLMRPQMLNLFRKKTLLAYFFIAYAYVLMVVLGFMDFSQFTKGLGILIFMLFFIIYDYYNKYFPGGLLSMPPPLSDGIVTYEDGTEATTEQMSKDLVNFLQWTAEPEMEVRKRMGIKVLVFLAIMTLLFWIGKKNTWRNIR